jgi:hypothetical protein
MPTRTRSSPAQAPTSAASRPLSPDGTGTRGRLRLGLAGETSILLPAPTPVQEEARDLVENSEENS